MFVFPVDESFWMHVLSLIPNWLIKCISSKNSAFLFVYSVRSFSHDPQLFCIEGDATRFKRTSGCGRGRHLAFFGQWKDTNSFQTLYLILRIIITGTV